VDKDAFHVLAVAPIEFIPAMEECLHFLGVNVV
jgi:hypothetical protein